ncbi:MAG: putative entry exclusion protein TrbK-alt [Sphingomonas sp.]|jgi:conjugative transfer region protein TrbK|uniref:putative entry exclusion protein TrbK-alt n=1 Tax=Sphingomonas sp. TaxID=28214 RepID=UPI00356A2889
MDGHADGARLWRGAAVAALVTVAMLAMTRLHLPPAARARENGSAVLVTTDPLFGELRRCQLLGQAAAADTGCLRAWAENRRRFMAPGARPQAAVVAGGR